MIVFIFASAIAAQQTLPDILFTKCDSSSCETSIQTTSQYPVNSCMDFGSSQALTNATLVSGGNPVDSQSSLALFNIASWDGELCTGNMVTLSNGGSYQDGFQTRTFKLIPADTATLTPETVSVPDTQFTVVGDISGNQTFLVSTSSSPLNTCFGMKEEANFDPYLVTLMSSNSPIDNETSKLYSIQMFSQPDCMGDNKIVSSNVYFGGIYKMKSFQIINAPSDLSPPIIPVPNVEFIIQDLNTGVSDNIVAQSSSNQFGTCMGVQHPILVTSGNIVDSNNNVLSSAHLQVTLFDGPECTGYNTTLDKVVSPVMFITSSFYISQI